MELTGNAIQCYLRKLLSVDEFYFILLLHVSLFTHTCHYNHYMVQKDLFHQHQQQNFPKFKQQNSDGEAKKKICGFPVSSYKNLGRVGRF